MTQIKKISICDLAVAVFAILVAVAWVPRISHAAEKFHINWHGEVRLRREAGRSDGIRERSRAGPLPFPFSPMTRAPITFRRWRKGSIRCGPKQSGSRQPGAMSL